MPLDYKFSYIKLKNEPAKTPCKNAAAKNAAGL